mgnify:CR=1 FL=1
MMNPHEIDTRKFPFAAAYIFGFSDGMLNWDPNRLPCHALNRFWYLAGFDQGQHEISTWLERRPWLQAYAGDSLNDCLTDE